MNPARAPRRVRSGGRLLVVSLASGSIEHRSPTELPALLEPGDLLVFNDAATLPASLTGCAQGEPIELRLLGAEPDGSWRVVTFGAGDHRTPTERRPAPPHLSPRARIELVGLTATVEQVLEPSPRLLRVRFDARGAELWSRLYRAGRPVQYAYVSAPLELWDVQTAYASVPWAAEAPSAGHPFDTALLLAVRRGGLEVATVTHAAGLSSTGDPALDAALPLEERLAVPARTADAVQRARRAGRRVIAVGTSVVRALESRAAEHGGPLQPGEGSTRLRIGPGYRRRVVDGLWTGMHEPTESHYALLTAFAPRALLDRALAEAEAAGYLGHEFGDACLLL
jgi:S-adenosylmethionine:tRNA ribosyltransferase-isomerase